MISKNDKNRLQVNSKTKSFSSDRKKMIHNSIEVQLLTMNDNSIKHRIRMRWTRCRKILRILTNQKSPIKLK